MKLEKIKFIIKQIRTDIMLYKKTRQLHYGKRVFTNYDKIKNEIEFQMLKETVRWK